jgi:hypothetical protein
MIQAVEVAAAVLAKVIFSNGLNSYFSEST